MLAIKIQHSNLDPNFTKERAFVLLSKFALDMCYRCKINVAIKLDGDRILMHSLGQTKFSSLTVNKIPLSASDPRRAKLKRDFLKSERLTEAQFTKFQELLFYFFDTLQISADIYEGSHVVRAGLVNYGLIKPKTFPVEK